MNHDLLSDLPDQGAEPRAKKPYVSDYWDPFEGQPSPPAQAYEADFGDPRDTQKSFQNDPEAEAAFQAREEERRREREALYGRLNERQAQAVDYPAQSLLVLAGAGSGKTSVLTARIAKLVSTGRVPARGILAVTFTNKASQEMQQRLRKLLDARTVRDIWMGTFHSLCSRMLRENAEAAGLPKTFAILDTDGQEAIARGILKDFGLTKASVKEAAKARAAAAASADLLTAVDPMAAAGALAADDLEADGGVDEFVTPAQCARYISSRKEGGHAPEPPLSITTRSTDIEQMEAVYAEYQKRCEKSGLLDFQDLLTKGVALLRDVEDVREKYRDRFEAILVDEFQDTNKIQYEFLQLIKSPKAHVMAVGDDSQSIYAFRGADPSKMFEFVQEMTVDAEAPEGRIVKLEQNYRSLPHILDAANAIIGRNPKQLPKTLFTSQPDRGERIDLIEFGNGMFEASTVARKIHELVKTKEVPPAEIAVLYRTNQQSRLIEQELNKLGLPLTVYGGYRFYDRAEIKAVLAYLDLVCDMTRDLSFGRVANMPPRGIGERTIEELRQQAKMKGVSLMEMVGERSQQLLVNPKALGNAASVKKQRQLEAFADIILQLADEAAELPLSDLITQVVAVTKLDEHYRAEAGGSKAGQEESEERLKNIGELVSAARQFELENPELVTAADQLPEYLAYVALMTSTSESDMSRKNTVSLMTVHSSKGLEFDHIFLTGLEESCFPHSRAIMEDAERGNGKSIDEAMAFMGLDLDDDGNPLDADEEAQEDGDSMQEERRLMYVAVTRARKSLTLTHAKQRLVNGKPEAFTPSRFLNEIPSRRLRRIDDSKQSDKWSSRGADNREYGGDAFDEGRAEYRPAARRPELREQSEFDVTPSVAPQDAPSAGAVRVVSKRRGGVAEAAGEVVIDVDRSHPTLGNVHYLHDHNDDEERAQVIAAYRADFERDMAVKGPMFRAVVELADRVRAGERIALRCWCAPRNCHADIVRDKVLDLAAQATAAHQAPAPAPEAAGMSARAASAGRQVAIIGTAGRDRDRPMTRDLWQAMLADADGRVGPDDVLVSGGAAWADHLAVRLFLDGRVKGLVLHLPAPIDDTGRFAGPERESAGSVANYYHGLFKRATGVDGLAEIRVAIAKGAKVTQQPAAKGYGAMFARNALVAKAADTLLAYTFGEGDVPADGGTKNTWDAAAKSQRTHIALLPLLSGRALAPTARGERPAAPTAQPSAPAATTPPWKRPWQRSGEPAAGAPAPAAAPAPVHGGPSQATRNRMLGLGRRPSAPRPR